MRAALRAAIFVAGWPLLSARGQTPPSLADLLARVRENVGQFETTLPDFVCSEHVTSRRVINGRTVAETVNDSTIVGTLKGFIESREIAAINGKKVSRAHNLKGPYIYLGGFSNLLIFTFGPKYTERHDYKIASTEIIDGRKLLALEFCTKEGQTELSQEFWHGGPFSSKRRSLPSRDIGKAWIDAESMQVVRLETSHLNLPEWVQAEKVATDYAPVIIDGKPFWMPKSTKAEDVEPSRNPKTPALNSCVALYGEYRKFDASAVIRY
jgi:hypothetical protein